MLRVDRYLKHISLIHKNIHEITNCGFQYSQRCNYDDCDCIIPEPKCKKRPEVVKEVNCEKCSFECWQYKPRPRFAGSKTQEDLKKPSRFCTAGMKNTKKVKVEKCQNANQVDAPVRTCPKTFTGVRKPCKLQENPYKFENEKIPLPDWDFNKRTHC